MTVAQLGGLTGDAALVPVSEIPVTNDGEESFTMNDYADSAQAGGDQSKSCLASTLMPAGVK